MNKYIPYAIVFVVFASLIVLFAKQKSSITGNVYVINEIAKIEKLSIQGDEGNNNITSKGLIRLKDLVKGDKVAESYVKELEWLINKNESQHILHSTLFMREYIKTGKDVPCVPHELWHIALFARHGDIEYAKKQAKNIEKGYAAWERSIEAKRKVYPKSLDQFKQVVREAVVKLKKNDYSEKTLKQLELIGLQGIC